MFVVVVCGCELCCVVCDVGVELCFDCLCVCVVFCYCIDCLEYLLYLVELCDWYVVF